MELASLSAFSCFGNTVRWTPMRETLKADGIARVKATAGRIGSLSSGMSNNTSINTRKVCRIHELRTRKTKFTVESVTGVSGRNPGVEDPAIPPLVQGEREHGAQHQQLDAVELVNGLRDVFASGKTRSVEWRLEQLRGLARMMRECEADISEALRSDLNKPFLEGFISEITGVHEAAQEAAKSLSDWMKPQKVSTPLQTAPSTAAVIPEPLGVTLIISPWNYPFLLSLNPAVGALAAGNVVVIKPSELAPATSALIAKLVPLYLDSNAVRVVEGGVPETTSLLEQRWDKIFYTGSTRVGRIVMAAASKHLTPVTLELGGKCPVIVAATSDLEVVARRIAWGKWASNNGQACIAPDYVLAEKSIVPELVKHLKASISHFYGDDPSKSSDISRIVNRHHFLRLSSLLHDPGTSQKVIFGAEEHESNLFISPTIILDPSPDSPVMQEEVFGPLLPIITVNDVGEAIAFVNSRPKPLALYIFTSDKPVVEKVLQETSSGGVSVNDTVLQVATPNLPFGGVGESGFGEYHGKYSFDNFSHKKAVLYRELWGDSDLRCPPYTPKKVALLKSIILGDFIGVIRAIFGFK